MKWKSIAGIVLVILSVAAMYYWETRGRDSFLLVPVLAASDDIEAGTIVGEGDFTVLRVPPETVAAATLTPSEAVYLYGQRAGRRIRRNQQVAKEDFGSAAAQVPEGKSVYVLPQSWIYSRSSSLRAGDRVLIYAMPEKKPLGAYTLAFVRDNAEQEVFDTNLPSGVLERTAPSSIISSLEILCTEQEYFALFDEVQLAGPGSLLVVMEGNLWAGS